MVAAQAAGTTPLAETIRIGSESPVEIDDLSTDASGITAFFAGQHGLEAIVAEHRGTVR